MIVRYNLSCLLIITVTQGTLFCKIKMSVSVSQNKPVSLHTEAKSIKDWEAVCMHVCDRSESMMSETKAFLRLFDGLMQTYQKYRDMTQEMRNAIATNKDYIDVPDYHETYVFIIIIV